MEQIRQNGICIHARPWKEYDRFLHIFCEDGHVYNVLARGASRPKYKLKFAAQLFSTGEYLLTESKAGYYVLENASFGELSYLSIASSPDAYAAACTVCEIAGICAYGGNKSLYTETVAALGELAGLEDVRCDLIVLRMMLAAFTTSGYAFSFGADPKSKACTEVLAAPYGAVSHAAVDRETAVSILKPLSRRFAAKFEKLNSLAMLPL